MSNLNHMPHYEEGRAISPFDVIIDWQLDFFTGNVIKYIARLWRKPSQSLSLAEKALEDIDKALVYLQKERAIVLKEVMKEHNDKQLSIEFN